MFGPNGVIRTYRFTAITGGRAVAIEAATDLKVEWDEGYMLGDLVLDGSNELESDLGLSTAVLMSLFTDARAFVDDPLPDPDHRDRRGWWGDKTSEYRDANDQIGSRLWLLERSKTVSETLVLAEGYANAALKWLVDDGIATEVEVNAIRQLGSRGSGGDPWLALEVSVRKTTGEQVSYKFDVQWEATLA